VVPKLSEYSVTDKSLESLEFLSLFWEKPCKHHLQLRVNILFFPPADFISRGFGSFRARPFTSELDQCVSDSRRELATHA
jgi:hypothetical protein